MTTFSTSRTIPSDINTVFAAISNQTRLARWWGPDGFANVVEVCEFMPGGKWHFTMCGPDGKQYANENVFTDVQAPNKVVIQHVSEPKFRLTIGLSSHERGTRVSWEQVFEDAEVGSRLEHIVVPANEQNLDRLAAEVARYPQGMPPQITVSAIVAAPLVEIWRAYTTPADIMLWNAASDDWHTTAASIDLCVGGTFCSRMAAKDGSFAFDFEGTYTAVVEYKLIEYAFGDRMARVVFQPRPEGVRVEIVFDAETMHTLEQQREGWQAILNRFKRHVER